MWLFSHLSITMVFAYLVIRSGFLISSSFSSTPSSSIRPFVPPVSLPGVPPRCPVPASWDQLWRYFDTSDLGYVYGENIIVPHLTPSFDTRRVRYGCSADAPGASTPVIEYARGAQFSLLVVVLRCPRRSTLFAVRDTLFLMMQTMVPE